MFDIRSQAIENGQATMQVGDQPKITVKLEHWQNGACHFRLSIGQPFQRVDPLLEWALRLVVFAPEDAYCWQRDRGIHKNVIVEWIENEPVQYALPVIA